MLSGAVNTVPTAQTLHNAEHIVFMPCGYVVKVKGDNITPGHIVGLAARSVKGTADKTANILEIVLLCFFKV